MSFNPAIRTSDGRMTRATSPYVALVAHMSFFCEGFTPSDDETARTAFLQNVVSRLAVQHGSFFARQIVDAAPQNEIDGFPCRVVDLAERAGQVYFWRDSDPDYRNKYLGLGDPTCKVEDNKVGSPGIKVLFREQADPENPKEPADLLPEMFLLFNFEIIPQVAPAPTILVGRASLPVWPGEKSDGGQNLRIEHIITYFSRCRYILRNALHGLLYGWKEDLAAVGLVKNGGLSLLHKLQVNTIYLDPDVDFPDLSGPSVRKNGTGGQHPPGSDDFLALMDHKGAHRPMAELMRMVRRTGKKGIPKDTPWGRALTRDPLDAKELEMGMKSYQRHWSQKKALWDVKGQLDIDPGRSPKEEKRQKKKFAVLKGLLKKNIMLDLYGFFFFRYTQIGSKNVSHLKRNGSFGETRSFYLHWLDLEEESSYFAGFAACGSRVCEQLVHKLRSQIEEHFNHLPANARIPLPRGGSCHRARYMQQLTEPYAINLLPEQEIGDRLVEHFLDYYSS